MWKNLFSKETNKASDLQEVLVDVPTQRIPIQDVSSEIPFHERTPIDVDRGHYDTEESIRKILGKRRRYDIPTVVDAPQPHPCEFREGLRAQPW